MFSMGTDTLFAYRSVGFELVKVFQLLLRHWLLQYPANAVFYA